MKGRLFFLHHCKDGMVQRLWFNDMGTFVQWLRDGKRRVAIEGDGDVLIIRDM